MHAAAGKRRRDVTKATEVGGFAGVGALGPIGVSTGASTSITSTSVVLLGELAAPNAASLSI